MTINPVLFGVLATLAIESAVLNVAVIGRYMVAAYKNSMRKRTTTKGGKYNG